MAYENAIPALRNTKEKYATDDEVCAGGSCRGKNFHSLESDLGEGREEKWRFIYTAIKCGK